MENYNSPQNIFEKYSDDQEFLRKIEALTSSCSCEQMEQAFDNLITDALLSETSDKETLQSSYYALLQAKVLWRQVRKHFQSEEEDQSFLSPIQTKINL